MTDWPDSEAQCDANQQLRSDDDACEWASEDFGGLAYRRPEAVYAPSTATELSEIVLAAAASGRQLVARGAAHSQGGQCLGRGALVVSTQALKGLESVSSEGRSITVGAGVTWRQVVDLASSVSLIPPVLTDHLNVSVGGTLSVGGIGPTTFRHGLQLHNCLGVEVVLGTGEVCWLTADTHPEIFTAVLGGLGRQGIITRARLALQPRRRFLHLIQATYESIDDYLNDIRALLACDLPSQLSAVAHPALDGDARRIILSIGIESDDLIVPGCRELMSSLSVSKAFRSREPNGTQTTRFDRIFSSDRYARGAGFCYPWMECILPVRSIAPYYERVQSWFPDARILLWPLGDKAGWPSVAMPDDEQPMLVGVLSRLQKNQCSRILPRLEAASRLGKRLGGKRYPSGWLGDEHDWQEHYGSYWRRRECLRDELDPHRVLKELP